MVVSHIYSGDPYHKKNITMASNSNNFNVSFLYQILRKVTKFRSRTKKLKSKTNWGMENTPVLIGLTFHGRQSQ